MKNILCVLIITGLLIGFAQASEHKTSEPSEATLIKVPVLVISGMPIITIIVPGEEVMPARNGADPRPKTWSEVKKMFVRRN